MNPQLHNLTVALNHTRRQLAYFIRKQVPEYLLADLRVREKRLHQALLRTAAIRLCAAQTPGDC